MNSIVLELQELASDGSRTVADLLRKALPDTLKPAKFDDISKRLKKELGELPALYQLRVALRFWTTPEVELLERVRAKYRRRPSRLSCVTHGGCGRSCSGQHPKLDYANLQRRGPQTVWTGLHRMHDFAICWRLFGPAAQEGSQLV